MKNIKSQSSSTILFKAKTPLGTFISTTKRYWKVITELKHPSVKGQERRVKATLTKPDEIRSSRKDSNVFLFYKNFQDRFLCIVTKHQKNKGFIVTVYYTKKVKEGDVLWKK